MPDAAFEVRLSMRPFTSLFRKTQVLMERLAFRTANPTKAAQGRPQLIRQISSGFSHEIKTPLSKISLPAELTYLEIERAMRERGEPDEFLETIQRRMLFIMDQIKLAAQRVDALQELSSAQGNVRRPQDLAGVVRKSLASVEDLMSRTCARALLKIPPVLPTVQADSEQLEILFTNLFKNAVEAVADLPPGKDRTISVCVREEASRLLIAVEDSGLGVPPEDRERIFQPHYTTKGPGGSGMGLFVCRRIVQAHGGTIDVRSEPGQGAEFIVRLPVTAH
jgi:signal transduction histidine kinase